jgi:hypothetical protein
MSLKFHFNGDVSAPPACIFQPLHQDHRRKNTYHYFGKTQSGRISLTPSKIITDIHNLLKVQIAIICSLSVKRPNNNPILYWMQANAAHFQNGKCAYTYTQ